jgi:uncharacterized membrane protein (DUF4010 family)
VAGAWFSTVATAVQLGLVAAAIHPRSLPALAAPLLAMLAAALLLALAAFLRQTDHGPMPAARRAFSPASAFGFAALLAGVTVAVNLAERHFGAAGASLGVALAGFADAHSATASALTLAHGGAIGPDAVGRYALLAVSTNTVSKILFAFANGGARYGWVVSLGLVAIAAAAWVGLLFT